MARDRPYPINGAEKHRRLGFASENGQLGQAGKGFGYHPYTFAKEKEDATTLIWGGS